MNKTAVISYDNTDEDTDLLGIYKQCIVLNDTDRIRALLESGKEPPPKSTLWRYIFMENNVDIALMLLKYAQMRDIEITLVEICSLKMLCRLLPELFSQKKTLIFHLNL